MAVDTAFAETRNTPDHDALVPDPIVQKELGVTAMCIWRWDRDDELNKLGWPPAIRIRSRKFRSRIALENFKRSMAHRAIEQRAQLKAPTAQGDRGPELAAPGWPPPVRNAAERDRRLRANADKRTTKATAADLRKAHTAEAR